MSINGITFDERYQKALVHGSFNQGVLSDGILNGCALSNNTTSMTVGVGTMIIGGRLIYFQAAETTNIVSPTGNYVRFYFKIDLTQTPDSETFAQGTIEYDYSSTLVGFAALTKEDINEDGNTYECEIAVYTLSGSNIDALVRSMGNASNIGGSSLSSAPSTDTTVSGITSEFTASANLAFGDVCYIDSNGKAALIDADAIASMTGIMMCADATIAKDASGTFLMLGFARLDSWNWTVGGHIYGTVTATSGNTMSQSAPTGTNDVVQILGVATHADRIYFNPQLVQVEVK